MRKIQLVALAILVGLLPIVPARAQRPDSVSLDGRWQFRFAPDDRGDAGAWYKPGVAFDRTLVVPGCWDAQGVGQPTDKMRHNAIGVGWYRRSFRIPEAWRGRKVWLVVGGVHRSCRVWLNGRYVGEHIGYPTSYRADLTSALDPGADQTLVVAVDSRRDPNRDPLVGAFDIIDYMDLTWGGIYEHVWIEATGDPWIDDVFAIPDPAARRATLDVTLGHDRDLPATHLAWRISSQGRQLASGELDLPRGQTTCRIPADLPNAPFWTPATPNLLTADVTLSNGATTLDRRTIHFGLRRLTIDGHSFRLNGQPFFLRGYGDDYTFPLTIAAPANVGFWRRYLLRRKAYGFNGVRHHSTMPSESYLTAADQVGMFVQPALPIAYESFYQAATPEGLKLYRQVWDGYIRQMRNHPSVFAWCMGNEEYSGLPIGPQLAADARSLDPTRPVIDSDGVAQGTDRPTLDYLSIQFNEWTIPWGRNHDKYELPPQPRPVVVHEMSNISVLPDPADIPRYSGVIKPFWLEQMADAVRKKGLQSYLPAMLSASRHLQASLLKLNLEAARLSPNINGYYQWLFRDYWTQSTGFVDQFDRERAITPEYARQFNAPAVLLWDHDRVSFRAGETVPLRIFLSDFRPSGAAAIRDVRVTLGDETVTLSRPSGVGGRGLIGPWTGSIAAPPLTTPRRLTLAARAGDVRNSWSVWIFPKPPPLPTSGVLLRSQLTARVLDRLSDGAAVLITDDFGVFPTVTMSFKPAWWKGGANDSCYGNLFLDHPALRGFPADGYGDLEAFSMLDARPVVLLDQVPGHIEPILWSLDLPWRMERKAYLFEAKVAKGRLLFSTLNLSRALRDADPAAAWMYSELARYAAGPDFRPTARLPLAWLDDRVSRMALPDSATWIEGYGSLVECTEPPAPWLSYREDNATSYVVRQTDGHDRLVWRTAPVPKGWSHGTVTFVWAGGIGWRSQPGGGHFSLALNGTRLLDFPWTDRSASWRSADGAATLRYVVRRTTPEDTVGLFFLTLPAGRLTPGKPAELSITATAQNSRRWVNLVPYTDVVATERGKD